MAAKPSNIRFMPSKTGRVHIVTTPGADKKNSKCGVVKAGHGLPAATGGWGKRRGVSPEAALDMDGCAKCRTHEVAESERKARMTPAQKRAEAKRKSDATRAKLSSTKTKKPKQPKDKKRRGPKGGDLNEKMKSKVEEHAAFAEKHGWTAKAWESSTNEWTCEATRSGETLKIIWRDGRTVWSRVVLTNGVEVRLRNSANWRKQAEGKTKYKSDYQPKSQGRGGKKAAKQEDIKDNAPRKLPFTLHDEDDVIIESLVGRRITWRNMTTKALDSAIVPQRGRNCRMSIHPKSERRIISFYESQGFSKGSEMLGGERSVYLDKILRVK